MSELVAVSPHLTLSFGFRENQGLPKLEMAELATAETRNVGLKLFFLKKEEEMQ